MPCKYLILGNGFLGNKFNKYLDESRLSSTRINSEQDIESEIQKFSPEFIINCVGKTGRPNVDWCENNKLETLDSNVLIPLKILKACQKHNVKMVHIGSGCIYEGENNGKGFSENDEPNFFGSFYSRTKILSEKSLSEFDVLQIRIRMPIDRKENPRNLITKLLKYRKIIDVNNSVSIISDTLRITKTLMDKNMFGVFNVVNKGPIKHSEILKIFEEESNKKLDYEIIQLEELNKLVSAGRSNCTLSIKKLENLGIEVPETKESLRMCIKEYLQEAK